jgi:ABC-2 type transport system ATP-binding protein
MAYRDELVERFQLDPSRRARVYSKGNRQKVLLIAALSSRADLLILGEPISGLDPLMAETFRECVAQARRRGQAVFLSSHILGEVEALSDRVAILRAGELVEVGTLAQMRHLSALSVDAMFDTAPPDLSRIPGVTVVNVEGNRVRCQVTGSVEPLLGVLAASGVHQLLSREPSLEELFPAHYGREPAEGAQARHDSPAALGHHVIRITSQQRAEYLLHFPVNSWLIGLHGYQVVPAWFPSDDLCRFLVAVRGVQGDEY